MNWAASSHHYYSPQRALEAGRPHRAENRSETARYGRVLALEQPEPGYSVARLLHCLDRTSRYSTATSRALYNAIEGLERHQAARKAREESAASTDTEPAKRPAELNEVHPENRTRTPLPSRPVLSKIRKVVSERVRPHRDWRGFTTPARTERE